MGSFSEVISSWHDFYMLTGSAAATLIGLIFISVSLHINVLAKAEKFGDIRSLASQTFTNFLLILSFAFIFMVPSSGPTGIGAPLLILGLLELGRTARLWLKFGFGRRSENQAFEASQMRWMLLLPNTICFLALIIVAIEILQGSTRFLDWMVMIIIWLLISASHSAWDLMLRLAEMKREGQV